MVKPMALEQGRLVKRVRTGTAQPATYEGVVEPEGMADAPIERLVKEILKKQAPKVIEIESPATKKVKKETSIKKKPPRKLTIKKRTLPVTPHKPSPSGIQPPETPATGKSCILPKGLSVSAKKALKDLRWKEGDDSPKGGATGKKKIRKTAVEKLKEGVWEAGQKPTKRQLNYDTDSEDY